MVTPRTIVPAISSPARRRASVAALGFTFPLLLRSPGYHTGRNFILVEHASELPRRGELSRRGAAGHRISRARG